MKKIFQLAGLVLATSLALGSSVALADQVIVINSSQPYIGAAVGYGNTANDSSAISNNNNGVAYNLYGGYAWNIQQWSVGGELAYDHFPTTAVASSSVNFMAVGKYFLNPRFNFTAKVGAAYTMQSVNAGEIGFMTGNVWQPLVDGGVAYKVSQHVSLTADTQYIFRNNTNGFGNPSLAILGGAVYNF